MFWVLEEGTGKIQTAWRCRFRSCWEKKKCGGMFLEIFVEQKDKYCFSCDPAAGECRAGRDCFLCRSLFDKIYGGVDRDLCFSLPMRSLAR